MEGQALFERIVALSGVSAVLAPGLVRRALQDGKVQVEHATAADYRAALPRILARMRAYLPEEEAQRRARRIGSLLAQLEAGQWADGEDEGSWSLVGRVQEALRGVIPAEDASRSPEGHERSSDEWQDVTVHGRRYTADEREVLRRSRAGQAKTTRSAEITVDDDDDE